jgi:hypothetical protein
MCWVDAKMNRDMWNVAACLRMGNDVCLFREDQKMCLGHSVKCTVDPNFCKWLAPNVACFLTVAKGLCL